MTVGAIVLEEKPNGRRLRLTRLLGSGYIGAVYEAMSDANTSNGEAKIAVKLPYANLSNDLDRRFGEEERVLARLYSRSGGRYVPNAWRGTLVDSNGPVLCMDLVRGKRMTDFFDTKKHRLPEALALESAVQYAALLTCLEQERVSCADRKVSDLYWDAEARQLTVLDWNVVDLDDKFRPGDNIATFGRLWFELLTGSLPPALDERGRLEQNPYWQALSLGTRAILGKALAPSRSSYEKATDLKHDLEIHWQDFKLSPPNLIQKTLSALDAVQIVQDEIRRAPQAFIDSAQVQSEAAIYARLREKRALARRLVDLVERVANAEAAISQVRTRNEALQRDSKEPLMEVSRMLEQRDYPRALQQAQRAAWLVEEGDAEALLLVQRWQLLAEAGQAGLQAIPLIILSEYRTDLVALVTALAQGEWDNASTQWQRLQDRLRRDNYLDTPVGRLLAYLGEESTVRQIAMAAGAAQQQGKYRVAAVQYAQMQTQLGQLASKHAYLDSLCKVMRAGSDLAKRIKGLEDASTLSGVEDLLQEIDKFLELADYQSARAFLESKREQERALGGVVLEQPDRTRLEQARQFIKLLNLLDEHTRQQRWDVLLAPNGLLDELYSLDQPASALSTVSQQALRTLVRQFWETLLSTLQQAYTRGDDPWQRVAKESQARMLCDLLEQLQHWVPPTIELTSIGSRALASPGATSAERAVEVNARWTWIQQLLDSNQGTTIEPRTLLQAAVTNGSKLQQRLEKMIEFRRRYFANQDEGERQQVLREADDLSIEIIEGHRNNAIRQANALVELRRQLPDEDALATFLSKLGNVNVDLNRLAESRGTLEKDISRVSHLSQEKDQLKIWLETTTSDLGRTKQDLVNQQRDADNLTRQLALAQAKQALLRLNEMDAVKYAEAAQADLDQVRAVLDKHSRAIDREDPIMHRNLALAEKEWQTWRALVSFPNVTPSQFAESVVAATRQTETGLSQPSKEFVRWLHQQNHSDLPGCLRRLLQQAADVSSGASQFEADHLRWWQDWCQWAESFTQPLKNSIEGKRDRLKGLRSTIEGYTSALQPSNTLIMRELLIGWLQRIQAAESLAQTILDMLPYLENPLDKKRSAQGRIGVEDRLTTLYTVLAPEVVGLFEVELRWLHNQSHPKQTGASQIDLVSDLKTKFELWQTLKRWFARTNAKGKSNF